MENLNVEIPYHGSSASCAEGNVERCVREQVVGWLIETASRSAGRQPNCSKMSVTGNQFMTVVGR